MKIHKATKIFITTCFVIVSFCFILSKPEANFSQMEGVGRIVQFKWYGYPIPFTQGAFAYNGNATALEAMNEFIFTKGHIWFVISVWALFFMAVLLFLSFVIEYICRTLAHNKKTTNSNISF